MDGAVVNALCTNTSKIANSTNIHVTGLPGNSNTTESDQSNTSSNDPLLYIITVLMFYALSMTILMVKYIRREKQEAEFSNYYYEYVSRDRFHTPQYENSQHIKRIMDMISDRKDVKSSEKREDNTDTEQLIPTETNNVYCTEKNSDVNVKLF